MYWFTGLPGAGKSTLAEKLVDTLRAAGEKVEWLDGDAVRKLLPGIGFDRASREVYLRHMAFLASVLERNGITVVASFVSPYKTSRALARSLCRNFCEIHVATPLLECERRDPKGQYRRARSGELLLFTGVSDLYESPDAPELSLDTSTATAEECLARLQQLIRSRSEAHGCER